MDDADLERRLRALPLIPPPVSLDARVSAAWWRARPHRSLLAAGIVAVLAPAAWWTLQRAPAAPLTAAPSPRVQAVQQRAELWDLGADAGIATYQTRLFDPQQNACATISQRVVQVPLIRATSH